MTGFSVIIPANNEERYIGDCIASVIAQRGVSGEVIVAANACSDRTVEVARAFADQAEDRGWRLTVLDLAEPGKPNALNRGDEAATRDMRAYVDADVRLGPGLLAKVAEALATPEARFASGRLKLAPVRSRISRAYARIWLKLPFMTGGVTGAGFFAVNGAGRARWTRFPGIISDDTYVRLLFTPAERIDVDGEYSWPLPEGLTNLLAVRRRQDAGVAEVRRLYPEMMRNEGKAPLTVGRVAGLFLRSPLSFFTYAVLVAIARVGRGDGGWSRGR